MSSSSFRADVKRIAGKTPDTLAPDAILAICVGRNEAAQIPWFLEYYRNQGVDHFLYIDNDSDDATHDLLSDCPDVTLYHTKQGYLDAANGRHWSMQIARSHAPGHWCLTVDLDEILVYPLSETVGLRALTDWMDTQEADALLTLMVDMYPARNTPYQSNQSFIEASPFFDEGPYWVSYSKRFPHVSFYGGARHRLLFDGDDGNKPITRAGAPVLRKVPLVKWRKNTRYLASTHSISPCALSDMTGALLHFKFLKDFHSYAENEVSRGQRNPGEYEDYLRLSPEEFWQRLHGPMSVKYQDTAQLVSLGLIAAPKSYLTEIFPAARRGLEQDDAKALWLRFKSARLAQARRFQMQIGHKLTDRAAKRSDF